MRKQWYLGFFSVVALLVLILIMNGHGRWIVIFLVPVTVLWLYDLFQKKRTLPRNFPVLAHFRYILEFLRPEIQQYFIADNEAERPYNREIRSIIYQRAKNVRDTVPFGTERDILRIGYTWVLHSMSPKHISEVEPRLMVGGPGCTQPYCASRLNISGMSFGALSAKALEALNKGAKLGGFAHNTGEGGLSPYHLQGGDLVFQIGTGYFGCRDEKGHFSPTEFQQVAAHDEVKMIEIKISQGAKPSHGGILPKAKLTKEIAEARKVPMGADVFSPPAHQTFHSPIGLLHFIKQLRELSGGKPIGFKLCIGRREEFLGICKAMLETNILPDFITVDGAEGGTGAAPLEYVNQMGEPLEPALVFVHNALEGIGVRQHIRIICSGKIATGFDLVSHIAMGADICNAARAMMMAIGCVQSKQCNANTCPTGVATQNKRLQRGLVVDEKMQRVANFHRNTMKSFLEMVGSMGLSNPSQLRPYLVMRRVNEQVVKPLNEVYEYLRPGDLLNDEIPKSFQPYWDLARADRFTE